MPVGLVGQRSQVTPNVEQASRRKASTNPGRQLPSLTSRLHLDQRMKSAFAGPIHTAFIDGAPNGQMLVQPHAQTHATLASIGRAATRDALLECQVLSFNRAWFPSRIAHASAARIVGGYTGQGDRLIVNMALGDG